MAIQLLRNLWGEMELAIVIVVLLLLGAMIPENGAIRFFR